jgi:hypothetical protein
MEKTDIKYRINKRLDNLELEQLILIDKILQEFTFYFQANQALEISSKTKENSEDPLAQLRNSDFIGCFSDESDLAEKSETIAHEILSKTEIH